MNEVKRTLIATKGWRKGDWIHLPKAVAYEEAQGNIVQRVRVKNGG